MLKLNPSERLYISADECCPVGTGRPLSRLKTLGLASKLQGTGVGIVVGSNLLSYGMGIIDEISGLKVPCWVDLGHVGSVEQASRVGTFLFDLRPQIITVSCTSSIAAMTALKQQFAGADAVLGVADLSGMTDAEIVSLYNCDPVAVVIAMARRAKRAGFDGCVIAPEYAVAVAKTDAGSGICITGVRPAWSIKANEPMSKIMTPEKAFMLRAERIVVGATIAAAEDPQLAVIRTIEEMIPVIPGAIVDAVLR